jgi:hypothetical protein
VTARRLAHDLGEDVTVRGRVAGRAEEALLLRAGRGRRVLVVAGPSAAALPRVCPVPVVLARQVTVPVDG